MPTPRAVSSSQGSGLTGLDDRVSALGGTLEIDRPVGAGTTIRARIPLSPVSREYAHA